MKKQFLYLVAVMLLNFTIKAQTPHCLTDEYYNEAIKNDPQIVKNMEALELFTVQFIKDQQKTKSNKGTRALPYIIPVVFHILHDYGPENVSDNIIIEAVRLMNLEFRKQKADTVDIIPSFKQIAADCEIEFRLARIDPNGNCTNGIEHIYTKKTYNADASSHINSWANNKYLNIWVANSLEDGSAAAYAYLPGGAPGSIDGIMCWYTYVNNASSTLTHEAGHSFNLRHTWGGASVGTTCGNDLCDDTPVTKGWSPGNCVLSGSVCNPPIIENVQNYMDYAYCYKMFTMDQKTRMFATLNSSVSGRNNLWQDSNLVATGTDGSLANDCVPISDFKTSQTYVCSKDSVQFVDLSWRGVVTSWNWSFPGGSPSTSTLQNPAVLYPAGVFGATLKVSNAAGTDSIVKDSLVRLTDAPLNTIPFVESFEDSASFPGNDGYVVNPDKSSTWERVNNAGSTGVASIKMNNYTGTAGAIDEWVTPSFNFSDITFPITVSFKVANAQRSSTSNDELKLFYSNNCGQTWLATSYSKGGAALSTVGILTSAYKPIYPQEWRQEIVIVNAVKLKPNVRFKFQNISDRGNNTYIDDINITGIYNSAGDIDELQTDFSLFPNPTSGVSTVNFSLSKSNQAKLEVKDILGRVVSTVLDKKLDAGIHELTLPVLTPGIYLVDLVINNKHYVRKLVVS